MIVRAGYGVYFDQTSGRNVRGGHRVLVVRPISDGRARDQRLALKSHRQLDCLRCGPKSRELWIPQVKPSTPDDPSRHGNRDPLVSPRWQHWNIGIQRQLYSGGVIDAGYVASRGDHLLRYPRHQPAAADRGRGPWSGAEHGAAVPGLPRIVLRETTAKSRYHGMLVGFRHGSGYGLGRRSTTRSVSIRRMRPTTTPCSMIRRTRWTRGRVRGGRHRPNPYLQSASYIYQLPFGRSGIGRLA